MNEPTLPQFTQDQWVAIILITCVILYGISRFTALIGYLIDRHRAKALYANSAMSTAGFQLPAVSSLQKREGIVPPPPIQQPAIINQRDLFQFMRDIPHFLIVGSTGSGKTTFARAIASMLDCKILVIDPDYKPGSWGDLRVITTGVKDDFEPIRVAITKLNAEMIRRVMAYRNGLEHTIPWLVIIWDELPACVDEIPEAGKVLRRLAQRSRKYKIKLIVLTQSERVKALGFDGYGDTKNNFITVNLVKTESAYGSVYQATMNQADGAKQSIDTSWISSASTLIHGDRSFELDTDIIDDTSDSSVVLDTNTNTGIDTIQDTRCDAIRKALRAGLSHNDIYSLIGGNRNARMALIRRLAAESAMRVSSPVAEE